MLFDEMDEHGTLQSAFTSRPVALRKDHSSYLQFSLSLSLCDLTLFEPICSEDVLLPVKQIDRSISKTIRLIKKDKRIIENDPLSSESAVKVIESDPSVCLCARVHSHN